MCNRDPFTLEPNCSDKPAPGYTNKQWQHDFAELKEKVQLELMLSEQSSIDGLETPYDSFLESVLYTIRHGEVDVCYHIYQIVDLLKYEKDLQSRYVPSEEYFRVWL